MHFIVKHASKIWGNYLNDALMESTSTLQHYAQVLRQ